MPLKTNKNILVFSLGILFLFLLNTKILLAQVNPVYFKLDAPQSVKQNSEFSVSFISRVVDLKSNKLQLNIFVDDGIKVLDVYINQKDLHQKLSVYVNSEISHANVYSTEIYFDKINFDKESVFQISYNLKSNYKSDTEIGFSVKSYQDEILLNKYTSRGNVNLKFDLALLKIDFFEESLLEKKSSLKFGMDGSLYIKPINELNNDLTADFWINFENNPTQFFSLLDDLSGEKIISFSKNNFGILSLEFDGEVEVGKECFISNKVWNHLLIRYSQLENSFDIYVNDSLAFSIFPYSFLEAEKISYFFKNADSENNFELYGFRILDFDDEISDLLNSKNYSVLNLENSNILFSLNSSSELSNNSGDNNSFLVAQDLKINKQSNVPIFSQAPKCNVSVQSNYYSIEWDVSEKNNADYFVIEKSESGSDFIEIGQVISKFEANDTYYFSDLKQDTDKILYYRIKQINLDKSVVYSSIVKIGISEIEEFILAQNYPNPFNPETRISVEIIIPSEFDINVYDVTGEKVAKLHKGFLSQGVHEFVFNGSELPSGIYFFEIKSKINSAVKKMILAK